MSSVVTANDLRSGAVVYLGPGGRWLANLAEATIASDAASLKHLEVLALAAVEKTEVIAVYAMDVALENGRPEPISVREKIRAAHTPTV